MKKIKAIVLAKFGAKRLDANREAIWAKCKVAIGQKCKSLRNARRGRAQPEQNSEQRQWLNHAELLCTTCTYKLWIVSHIL